MGYAVNDYAGWICSMSWFDDEDELDEKKLLKEFEQMLGKDEDNPVDPEKCYHQWTLTGHGPVTNTPWYDCKKCKIKKEDYEKTDRYDWSVKLP